jgi:hypothetical protein
MGLYDPFGHLKYKLWPKERSGVKLVVWLSTIKSQELTQFICVQVVCDISLKRSRQGLQLCFRPHLNPKFACEIMGLQSCKSPNFSNFGTPTWESWDKMPFGCEPCGEAQSIYYKGEGGGFPQVRAVVSLVSPNCQWLILAPKVFWLCINHLVLVLWRFVWVVEACQFFLVPSWSFSMPLYPFKVLQAKERA